MSGDYLEAIYRSQPSATPRPQQARPKTEPCQQKHQQHQHQLQHQPPSKQPHRQLQAPQAYPAQLYFGKCGGSGTNSSCIVPTAPSTIARKWGAETPIVKQMIKQAQEFSKRYVLPALLEE